MEQDALSSSDGSEDEEQPSKAAKLLMQNTRHAQGMIQHHLAMLGIANEQKFDATIEVERGHSRTIGQRRFSKVVDGVIVGRKAAPDMGAGTFFEEYKAEKIPEGDEKEGSDYSDASDMEKELAGISAMHKKTVSARNAKEHKLTGAAFQNSQEGQLKSGQNTIEMQAFADKKEAKVL